MPVYILTHSGQYSLFFTSLLAIIIYQLFDNNHSNSCEVISRCGCICISLVIRDFEHISMYLLSICMSPLKKCLCRFFPHFKIRLFVFFAIKIYVSYTFYILTLYLTCDLQIFSFIPWVAISFCWLFHCRVAL